MKPRRFGRAVRRSPGAMNKLEAEYAAQLAFREQRGEILAWAFEPETLRLAKRTAYTPDFRVIAADGVVEFHEVKGFWEDDARVKIKVAAEMHPYRFIAVQKDKAIGWVFETFGLAELPDLRTVEIE